jgi:thiol-disulfide isomerase/thioredoxin
MKKIVLICAVLLTMLQAADTVHKPAPAETFTLKAAGEPSIVAKDMPNGMSFQGYEGKPVVLIFFGKNCPYCRKEIPGFVAMKKKYGNKIGIIALHVQERITKQERAELQKQYKINYPIYEYDDNAAFVKYVGSRARFNGSIPFNIFFNAKGEVAGIIPGYVDEKKLDAIFVELLKK